MTLPRISSLTQLEGLLESRGFSPDEVEKLSGRVDRLKPSDYINQLLANGDAIKENKRAYHRS